MTDRTSGPHRTTSSMEDTLRWVNVSGETIPAYGVVQLRSNYASGYSQASKPNDTAGLFFANGAVAVLGTKKGESLLWSRPQLVMVTGSPAVGTQVGPVSGSWAMSETGTGFYVVHQPVAGVAAVVQVGGGGGGESRWGLVVSGEGCGIYTIELGTMDEPASGSGSGSCNPCTNVTGAGTSACELVLEYPAARVTGSGEYVTAYDPTSILIPLLAGTDCVVTRMGGAEALASGSGPATPTWSVRGLQEHIVQYRERWDCCEPNGPPVLVGKTPVIFAGKVCDEILCGECPASGSGS
jgi:hypothetical protein